MFRKDYRVGLASHLHLEGVCTDYGYVETYKLYTCRKILAMKFVVEAAFAVLTYVILPINADTVFWTYQQVNFGMFIIYYKITNEKLNLEGT